MEELYGNIKENFESFGKVIAETAETVARKTEDTIEIQKIKSKIRVMVRNNKRDYQDIGKIIYERFQNGQIEDEELLELCQTIEEREEVIDDYKKEVAVIKGLKMCRSCKTHLEPNSEFCSKCGTKVKDDTF